MVYYLIQGYSKEEDKEYKTHIHPNYLTSYNLKLGGPGFGFQSGLHDALKCTDEETANKWKAKGEEVFGHLKELEVVPIDARVFGRVTPKYIV